MNKKIGLNKTTNSFRQQNTGQKQKNTTVERDKSGGQKKVYIYAQVDIDKLFTEVVSKSKKVRVFMEENRLQIEFLQNMRKYKNLRICFDNEIQQFIYKKELNKELKNVKKNVFAALEDFLIARFAQYLEQQRLHREYKQKVSQIEGHFSKRMAELMKNYV